METESKNNSLFYLALKVYLGLIAVAALGATFLFHFQDGKYVQWYFEAGEYEQISNSVLGIPSFIIFAIGLHLAVAIVVTKDIVLKKYFQKR